MTKESKTVKVYLKGNPNTGVIYNGKDYFGEIDCDPAFAASLVARGKASHNPIERPSGALTTESIDKPPAAKNQKRR